MILTPPLFCLYYAKKHKAYGIDSEIGKHMCKPRDINIAELEVKKIEYHSPDAKPDYYQHRRCRRHPAHHHSDVVEGKGERAENKGKLAARYSSQRQIGKSAEEKFLQERIYKGYVECDKNKTVLADADIICQRFCNAAKVENSSQCKISAYNNGENADTEGGGDGKAAARGAQILSEP